MPHRQGYRIHDFGLHEASFWKTRVPMLSVASIDDATWVAPTLEVNRIKRMFKLPWSADNWVVCLSLSHPAHDPAEESSDLVEGQRQ